MMRKLCFLVLALFWLPLAGLAEGTVFTVAPQEIHPGLAERISFYAPEDGEARIEALRSDGSVAAVIRAKMNAYRGVNHLTWDGCGDDGYPLMIGEYALRVTLNGDSDQRMFQIGEECPQFLSLRTDNVLEDGREWHIFLTANMASSLTVRLKDDSGAWRIILDVPVEAGENDFSWDGLIGGKRLPHGRYEIQLSLADLDGTCGDPAQLSLAVVDRLTPSPIPSATPQPTPAIVVPSKAEAQPKGEDYWSQPIGFLDEETIWALMMQPITVITGNQTEVYPLRKTPDKDDSKENIVGEITYASQGLHVLETRDDGWTLVEAYNSSYGPLCGSRPGYGVTDDLIQGYVKTSLLKTITPKNDYALLVDKLTQTMYIFKEGHIIGELLVSTGKNTATQPWNETPAGEFLMVSRMGGFQAGNLYCPFGMRINGGCAIHEVPFKGTAETPKKDRDYSLTRLVLGKKASHGCVRVQNDKNGQGQNMEWLFNNIKVNTKVWIWDDTGRRFNYPDDETQLYYNPNNGRYYHEDQNCESVSKRYLPLTPITYKDLNDQFPGLTACPKCTRLMNKQEIDDLNRENNAY